MATNFEIVKNKVGKARVWAHFGFVKEGDTIDKKRVACRLCYTILKHSGNTSNLQDHLRRKHPTFGFESRPKSTTEEREVLPSTAPTETREATISTFFSGKTKLSSNSQRSKNITDAIAQFLVQDLRPYSVVQNPGFKNLLSVLEPKYTVPSRQHFSDKLIPELYFEVSRHVKNDLRGQYVSITTDGWTSRATESYVTVTSVHIDNDWKVKNYVLQTRAMEENHTGQNIADVLQEAVREWGLPNNPPLVSDNASNMTAAAREFGTEFHVGCFAHTLNLACQKALKIGSVAKLLGRMRNIVTYFHKSCVATACLKQKQELLQLPQHKLIMDVPTRWNSGYEMIVRFLEQQPAIFAVLTSKEMRNRDKNISLISDSDISSAEDLVAILKPLHTATNVLCDESSPTASMILPLQNQLLSMMNENESDSEMVKLAKKAIKDDLSSRYKPIKKKLTNATLLDPRFKLAPFLSEEEKLSSFHDLTLEAVSLVNKRQAQSVSNLAVKQEQQDDKQIVSDIEVEPPLPSLGQSSVSPVSSPEKKKIKSEKESCELVEIDIKQSSSSAMSSLFGDVYITHIEEAKSPYELCEQEVTHYKKENPISANDNPLLWWKGHCDKYPFLKDLAKLYLSVPATSVPSERVFSTAGDIVTAQRSCLKPDHVDKLIFLKKNWHPIPK